MIRNWKKPMEVFIRAEIQGPSDRPRQVTIKFQGRLNPLLVVQQLSNFLKQMSTFKGGGSLCMHTQVHWEPLSNGYVLQNDRLQALNNKCVQPICSTLLLKQYYCKNLVLRPLFVILSFCLDNQNIFWTTKTWEVVCPDLEFLLISGLFPPPPLKGTILTW